MSRNAYLGQLNSLQELNAEIATLHGERSRIIGSTTAQLNGINRQQITLRSQLTAAQEEISNRTILAPKAGTIFDLKVGPYSVVTNSEILLKIVPSNQLQALIEIPIVILALSRSDSLFLLQSIPSLRESLDMSKGHY